MIAAKSYDCIWFPALFVTEEVLDAAVPRLVRSLRRGGPAPLEYVIGSA